MQLWKNRIIRITKRYRQLQPIPFLLQFTAGLKKTAQTGNSPVSLDKREGRDYNSHILYSNKVVKYGRFFKRK